MSRRFRDTILVQETIEPHSAGMDGVGGCCGLCRAPSRMPCCASILPCCSYPEALEEVRRESNYLIIRENAVEFNKSRVREWIGRQSWTMMDTVRVCVKKWPVCRIL